MMKKNKDTLFANPLGQVGDFRFDEEVVQVFPDMIDRSVPGYGSILALLGEIAANHAQPRTNIYDLGCSLGASTFAIESRVPADCQLLAVDSSPAMICQFRKSLLERNSTCQTCHIQPIESDLCEVEIDNASLVILNFTLQFIPIAQRDELLHRIAQGMNQNGALVLSEKVLFDDPANDELLSDLHHAFKRSNGYSDLEISQKRAALEQTLIRESLETHLNRLKAAGFKTATPWLQCFNFISILAIR